MLTNKNLGIGKRFSTDFTVRVYFHVSKLCVLFRRILKVKLFRNTVHSSINLQDSKMNTFMVDEYLNKTYP